jgi:hypothetical protein
MNMAMKSLDGVVQLRVLKVENGQTILASYFLLNELPNVNLNGSTPEFSVFDSVGKAMASRILDFIYPLKISGITGSNEVAIDRGGEGMSEGDVYDVFKIGDPLKDPTTGESMGFVETKVSTIELVRVLPKVSYAKVISKREPINIEYICRRSVGNSASNSRKTKPQSNPNDLDNLFK